MHPLPEPCQRVPLAEHQVSVGRQDRGDADDPLPLRGDLFAQVNELAFVDGLGPRKQDAQVDVVSERGAVVRQRHRYFHGLGCGNHLVGRHGRQLAQAVTIRQLGPRVLHAVHRSEQLDLRQFDRHD